MKTFLLALLISSTALAQAELATGSGGASLTANQTFLGTNTFSATLNGTAASFTGNVDALAFRNVNSTSSSISFSGTNTSVRSAGGTIFMSNGSVNMIDASGTRCLTNVPLTIGTSGTAIASSIRNTATLDFPSTAVATCDDLTITVTGAVVGADVSIGTPATRVTGSTFDAWVSATDTVSIRHCCSEGATCDPASATFSARVWNP